MADRSPEGADFKVARVTRAGGRPPIFAVGVAAVIAGLVVAGLGDGGLGDGGLIRREAVPSQSGRALAVVPRTPEPRLDEPMATDPRGRPFVPSLPWDVAAARRALLATGIGPALSFRAVARPGVFFPYLDASWEDRPGEPLTLATPIPSDPSAITGPVVAVRGELRLRAETVRVELLSLDRVVLASTDVVTNPDGGIRPVRTPIIDVALPIPEPRPLGSAWLAITAFDRYGEPISAMRRQVVIGAPSLEVRPAAT